MRHTWRFTSQTLSEGAQPYFRADHSDWSLTVQTSTGMYRCNILNTVLAAFRLGLIHAVVIIR